jgi:hypothetical protein
VANRFLNYKKTFRRGFRFITDTLSEYREKRRTLQEANSISKIRHVGLNTEITNVLIGELLGDAHIVPGINSALKHRKNPNGTVVPRIYFSKNDIKRFLEFIGESPVKSLEHRWRI